MNRVALVSTSTVACSVRSHIHSVVARKSIPDANFSEAHFSLKTGAELCDSFLEGSSFQSGSF
jgi:hypothetical protein